MEWIDLNIAFDISNIPSLDLVTIQIAVFHTLDDEFRKHVYLLQANTFSVKHNWHKSKE